MPPHRQQPTRLPHPWDSPGKNTGVGCHFLLQCMKVKSEREVAQSCLTLRDPMDCSLPGSSIHGIFQARVLEWGAIAFSGISGCYILSNAFSSFTELIMYFIFILLKWFIPLIDLWILNYTFTFGIKFHLFMVYDPFNVLLNSVCEYFVDFRSVFIRDISLWFSFLVVTLSGFSNRLMLSSWNVFGSVPSTSAFLGRVWEKDWYQFSFELSLEFTVKQPNPGVWLSGNF